MEHYKFFCNRECEYFPCHPGADPEHFNCLVPHDPENYDLIISRFSEIAELAKKM